MRVGLRDGPQPLAVDLTFEGATCRAVVDGTEHVVSAQQLDAATRLLTIAGRQYRVDLVRRGRERLVAVAGETYVFVPQAAGGPAHAVANVASPQIVAPMPGKVLQVAVHPGDHVIAGDTLLILEAMKMETRVTADAAACVAEVRVAAGDMVDGGQVLAVLVYDAASSA